MIMSLADKARANRRAALASLNARVARSQKVVSIFDGVIQTRKVIPEFHSIRVPVETAETSLERNASRVA